MSGIEPGRPKIEERDIDYIWVGTRVLNEHGQEFTVFEAAKVNHRDGRRYLPVRDRNGKATTLYGDTFRCRVEEEDR